MSSRRPIAVASLLCPQFAAGLEIPPQKYDYSFQLYQEDDDRIEVEAHYLRGRIDFNDETSFRFQLLNDAISGASPTGALKGNSQPYLSDVEDVRKGILGALGRQFGDHRAELEVSFSTEDDYVSRGITLGDTWELNQKNTTITSGFNYLNDSVLNPGGSYQAKDSYDFFAGVSQIIDKNTEVSVSLTLGYAEGYLNDPYKIVQRTELVGIPDGLGGTIEIPVVNIYPENRPDSRFRQLLQFEGRHYFANAHGALDAVLRLSHDDFGVFSETLQIEWRQELGTHFELVPFFRYYHQNAADFFVKTIDDVIRGTPSADPDGGGRNYSADYRLSSFNAVSGGLRLRYLINDHFSASAAYERYVMNGTGSSANQSSGFAYPSADIWTFGMSAEF